TSDEPAGTRTYGDWGGLIILGNAPINPVGGQATIEGGVNNAAGDGQYGGSNATDNSGILRYVRIEYGGIPFSANNEINGLTLGGVGNGTTVDYVMVSYNGDDSFEWFGGTVNCKHLIAYKGVDDDFDTDFGYAGKVQFGLAVRDANVADQAGDSNSFESDNDATGSGASPKTKALFSNITSIGPKVTSSSVVNSKYNNALRLRRNTSCSAYNSVFMGWPNGVFIEGDSAAKNANNDLLQIANTIVSGSTVALKKSTTNVTFDVAAWFNGAGKSDSVISENTGIMLTDPFAAVPNCLPLTGSPVLNRASFTNTRLTDAFFNSTSYIGAFGSDNWTATWTNFDPQNANYSELPMTASFSYATDSFKVRFTNSSLNAYTYDWNFGDNSANSTEENPVHTYASNGTYKVVLTTSNGVSTAKDSTNIIISVVGVANTKLMNQLVLYPNPVNSNATLAFNLMQSAKLSVNVLDINGRTIATIAENANFNAGVQNLTIDASAFEAGVYMIRLSNKETASTIRFVVVR
ncbi:MAG: hypothetical protein RI934_847, partial [Bacteroidota bacterium]